MKQKVTVITLWEITGFQYVHDYGIRANEHELAAAAKHLNADKDGKMADKQAEFTATNSNGVISTGAMHRCTLYGPRQNRRAGRKPPRKMSGK